MGQGYLADTNTIIDYLENKLPDSSNKLLEDFPVQLSVISRIELLAWNKASPKQLNLLNQFISTSIVFNLDEDVILKSIEIRKAYKIKLPDAIIAATAAVYNLILLTRNISDFKNISSLPTINPYS